MRRHHVEHGAAGGQATTEVVEAGRGENADEHVERPPESLLRRLRAEPERAPELIALAAADRFAAPAQRYATRMRSHGHAPEEIARRAVRRHVHLARAEGAALGIGGAWTAAADLAALAWLESRMVFYIAAAHGYDPAHPMRPAELLALQGMYETPAEARAALDRAGRPLATALVDRHLGRSGEQTLRRRLLGFVSHRMALKFGGRLVPFLSSAVSAVQNGNLIADLGTRAGRYYGG
jgi:EcsC protein family